jgi:hypothetical protein
LTAGEGASPLDATIMEDVVAVAETELVSENAVVAVPPPPLSDPVDPGELSEASPVLDGVVGLGVGAIEGPVVIVDRLVDPLAVD